MKIPSNPLWIRLDVKHCQFTLSARNCRPRSLFLRYFIAYSLFKILCDHHCRNYLTSFKVRWWLFSSTIEYTVRSFLGPHWIFSEQTQELRDSCATGGETNNCHRQMLPKNCEILPRNTNLWTWGTPNLQSSEHTFEFHHGEARYLSRKAQFID